MADERDRWLDEAAADRLLRGEPAEPVGPAAGTRAPAEAARLRAALDALAPQPPAPGELPGEAAALAAFRVARAARGAKPAGAVRSAGAARAAGSGPGAEPGVTLLDLGRLTPVAPSRSRSRRPVRFGLAAALASVAVGGLAAAAGAGLLDGDRYDGAGPAPAASVSADGNDSPDAGPATLDPQPRPTPRRGDPAPSPGPGGTTRAPDPYAPARPDGGTGDGILGGVSAGGTDADGPDRERRGATEGGGADDAGGGTEGNRDTFANGGAKDRDRDREARQRAPELCRAYREGRLDEDRREKLTHLASGLNRIKRYCDALLAGAVAGQRGDGGRPGSPGSPGAPPRSGASAGGFGGRDLLKAPTLGPARPGGPALTGRG
ncbi:hypothetical protein [Streptomyces subrutilus]|uniref:hypothetical protein n=1 Tax=Streptomyces subrutilus TaxID=36818 RepID=UPI0033D3B046